MLQNAMDLAVSAGETAEDVPVWAAEAVSTLSANGIHVPVQGDLTRGQVAQLLYQVSAVAASAPGLQMYQ